MAKKPVPPTFSQICDRLLHANAISVEEAHTLRQAAISTFLGEGLDGLLRRPASSHAKSVEVFDKIMGSVTKALASRGGWMFEDVPPGVFPDSPDSPLARFRVQEDQHDPGVIWVRSDRGESELDQGDGVQASLEAALDLMGFLTDQHLRVCIPQIDGPDIDLLVTNQDDFVTLSTAYTHAKMNAQGTSAEA